MLFRKCTEEKILVPIVLNSQKIKQELGDLFGYKNPTRAKKYFKLCFQLLKINELGQSEKYQQEYLSEKVGKAISVIRNTVINDAENLELVPIYDAKSG